MVFSFLGRQRGIGTMTYVTDKAFIAKCIELEHKLLKECMDTKKEQILELIDMNLGLFSSQEEAQEFKKKVEEADIPDLPEYTPGETIYSYYIDYESLSLWKAYATDICFGYDNAEHCIVIDSYTLKDIEKIV